MNDPVNKRNYIHRKKYLMDCVTQIKATLDFIRAVHGDKPGADTEKQALDHAQAIEAVCWSPRARLSAESYQQLMTTKTYEVCRVILKKSLGTIELAHGPKLTPCPPEPTPIADSKFPIPMIDKPQPTDNDNLQSISWPNPHVHHLAFDEFTFPEDAGISRVPIEGEVGLSCGFNRFEPSLNEPDGSFPWTSGLGFGR
jgi:hypothetical protein